MSLLARVAGRIYWGARYVERAEDTARIVRSFCDLLVDLPTDVALSWEPLVALTGHDPTLSDVRGEEAVMQLLLADTDNPGSIVAGLGRARDNLRTTREVLPREAWYALNGLQQFVSSEAERAVGRRTRDRFLGRVIDDSRRLDGVLESTMTRANPYWMWRLGRLIERADMTTRVVGVRAASILQLRSAHADDHPGELHAEVQWMSALRSVSALQMYQRATHGPIEGPSVVRFLLYYSRFPRSVQGCLDEMRTVLAALPDGEPVIEALDAADTVLAACDPSADDGKELDDSMERVQLALGDVGDAIHERFFAMGD
jgi:uncharacterized alpha-E superfamily protein